MARAQPCSKQVLPALATTLPHSKGVLCPQLGPTSHFQGKGCNPNCIRRHRVISTSASRPRQPWHLRYRHLAWQETAGRRTRDKGKSRSANTHQGEILESPAVQPVLLPGSPAQHSKPGIGWSPTQGSANTSQEGEAGLRGWAGIGCSPRGHGKPHSQGTCCPNSLGWSCWLTTSSRGCRGRGAGQLCQRPSTDGVSPAAARSEPQGCARGFQVLESDGSWSQAPQRSRGSASAAAAVAGKATGVGPRGNVPRPSPGLRPALCRGEHGLCTGQEEPDLKFGAPTTNY